MNPQPPTIAVIGGSGFYNLPGLTDVTDLLIHTPFGAPSDRIRVGTLGGRRVAFLARHGRDHIYSPSAIPAAANIWALKSLGVRRVISVSAEGSLREEIAPGHLALPDQLIDRTTRNPRSFFGEGIVGHVAFAEPFCPALRATLRTAAAPGGPIHDGGTLVVMEGPQFSTRAESDLHRSWGASYVGMTALPEARLAREAELCYATLALITDYDCWHDTHETVSAALVANTLWGLTERARAVLQAVIPTLPEQAAAGCTCGDALAHGIMTAQNAVSDAVRFRLQPIIGRYLPPIGV